MNKSKSSIEHKGSKLNLSKDPVFIAKHWSELRIGDKSKSWKGGKKATKSGYIQISKRGYPGTDKNGYILEHRYVMEQHLGRQLKKNEIIHHKNGNKIDNRIENLEIMDITKHTILHHIGKKRSEETRKNMSRAANERYKDGAKSPLYKTIDMNSIKKEILKGKTIKTACEELGISRRTYYNRIKKEGFNI